MANYYTSSKGITFDMDQAAQRYRTNDDRRTHKPVSLNVTNSKSGGNKSGTGGNTGTSGGGGNSALLAYMQALEARQRQAANNAYKKNVSAMNNAFSERSNLLKSNLDTTLQNLQTDYDASKANVNKDAQNSLQQAYINNMMSRKNLNQNMAAQGLSGGASETTMAGMYNNYGNARNNIQTVANDNLGELENLYNKNKNSAYQAYNDQLAQDAITKAQYMAQFESDRQNALANAYNQQMSQLMSLDPTYAASMMGLVETQQGYTPVATKAENAPKSVSTKQGSGNTKATYGSLLNRAVQMSIDGASSDDVIMELSNQGASADTIANILSQLRY